MSAPSSLTTTFREKLAGLATDDPAQVVALVDRILDSALAAGASDIHLVPQAQSLALCWRVDGVLHPVDHFPKSIAPNLVARLKVLADLLTYRTEIPQEGRIRRGETAGRQNAEMRLSTFPTLYGEKAVVRLFVGSGQYHRISDLELPADVETVLMSLLHERGGLILLTGPAGSGKTTTIYAALRELSHENADGRSLVSLEDPIEALLPGVAQSQVQPAVGFDYATGLRSLMRQDPDVIMVGEIRDRETAEVVFQASLTGHLTLTTFHAGSAAGSLSRLADMGIEPYLLRSGLLAAVSQRLVRRLCPCAIPCEDDSEKLGLPVTTAHRPAGCEACGGSGYRGRLVLAETLLPDSPEVRRAILARADAQQIEAAAIAAGMIPLWQRGLTAVTTGHTSPHELHRTFGLRSHAQ